VLLGGVKGKNYFLSPSFLIVNPFCAAEHRSCCWKKTLNLFEAKPSFLTSQHQPEAQKSRKDRNSWGGILGSFLGKQK